MGSTFGLGTSLLERLKKSRENDDWVDRFVYWVSPCVIILLAVIIGAKQFVGQPIQCWAPNEFRGQWMSYAESYCFVENTYFVSMREQFPMREIDREQREIIYYQWMSFLLFGQALLLMAPKFMWEAFNWKSGLNINVLVRKAHTRNKAGTREAMEEASRQLGTCIHGVLQQNARAKAQLDFSNSFGRLVPDHVDWKSVRPTHSFVSFHYILFKLLNLCSALVQLYLLNCFMVPANYTYWGFDVLRDLMAGRDWSRSGLFPRVTFCDFKIRQAAQHLPHQRFTLQCVIMINMFNEKVFIFLWFWLLSIVLLTAFNLLLWLYRIFSNKSAKAFIVQASMGHNPCAKKSQKTKHMRGFGRYPRMVHCSRCRQIVTTVVKHNSIFSMEKLFVHFCPNCQKMLGKHVHSMADYCSKCPHCKRQRSGGKMPFGRQPQKVYCSFCQQIVTSVTEETNGNAVFQW
uniref:Innexin n=1 Tax=Globodera pallida TaxID=36090 RepID=A0A183CFT7_GLOPA